MPDGCFAPVNRMIVVLFLGSFMALARALGHLPIATMVHSGHPI